MEPKEILDKFDAAVAEMAQRVAESKDGALMDQFNEVSRKRKLLEKALEKGDEAEVGSIISEVLEFGRDMEESGKGGFLSWLFGGKPPVKIAGEEETQTWVSKASAKDVKQMQKKLDEVQRLHELEMRRLQSELAENRFLIEGLKGAYMKMSKSVGEHRVDLEKEAIKDVTDLKYKIDDIKKGLDEMHLTVERELGSTKEAYSQFGKEMVYLGTKVAEIESTMERGEEVTEVDVISLKHGLTELENRLERVEAEEKSARVALLSELKKDHDAMLQQLSNRQKAKTKDILSELEKGAQDMAKKVEVRQAHLSEEMHKELKQSYDKLVDQLFKVQDDLRILQKKKSVTGEDVEEVSSKVERIAGAIERIEREEMPAIRKGASKEVSLAQKIELLGKKVNALEGILSKEEAHGVLSGIGHARGRLKAMHPKSGMGGLRRAPHTPVKRLKPPKRPVGNAPPNVPAKRAAPARRKPVKRKVASVKNAPVRKKPAARRAKPTRGAKR